jgi:hypothetical protein
MKIHLLIGIKIPTVIFTQNTKIIMKEGKKIIKRVYKTTETGRPSRIVTDNRKERRIRLNTERKNEFSEGQKVLLLDL